MRRPQKSTRTDTRLPYTTVLRSRSGGFLSPAIVRESAKNRWDEVSMHEADRGRATARNRARKGCRGRGWVAVVGFAILSPAALSGCGTGVEEPPDRKSTRLNSSH